MFLFFRKIIKSQKDDTGFVVEKKKYYDDSHKIKSEDISKVDEVKKIEFKIMKTTKLSNSNKHFDNDLKDELSVKSDKSVVDDSKEEVIEIKKKSETLKSEHIENKTSGSSKHKSHEDNLTADTDDTDINKKLLPDIDKKFVYNKRVDNRRQESKIDRRIRNKDRPAIEIYRPGMGRLSKLKADNDGVESESKN